MKGLLDRLVGRGGGKPWRGATMDYEEAKRLATDGDPTVRRRLAGRTDVRPEVLYYLAEDEMPEVRREIAGNQATPRQADVILADDRDDDVRICLARKIARLAPELSPAKQGLLQEVTLQVLEKLARDQLPRVRQIIAEEIKHLDTIPQSLVKALAKDVELIVCAPILEFSPLLMDDDLLEIILSDPVQGALSAISRRVALGERVSDAIVGTTDESAVADLLANPSAQIREETLDQIVEQAPDRTPWHEPLVGRSDLSHRAVHRIAQFVTAALLAVLERRYEIDPSTTREVAESVSRRLSADGLNREGLPEHRAAELYDAGRLDEGNISTAIDRSDRDFIIHALALKTQMAVDIVRQIISSKSAKVITALCWKAGLTMRTAIQVQLKVARVPANQVINARDGVDYPYSGSDMRGTLRFFAD